MKLIKIDKTNIQIAHKIQTTLFPESDAYVNYLESVEHITENEYWIIEVDGIFVGISGIYSFAIDPQSAWLGWFGILPEFQRRGFGSLAIQMFESEARKRGFKYVRLYTGRNHNDIAKSFYKHNGYKEEYYECPEDTGATVESLSVFSKNLAKNESAPLWADKNMNISEQLVKQKESLKYNDD